MREDIKISDYEYPLPSERIAKFPLEQREHSKLLVYNGGDISQRSFLDIEELLSPSAMVVFNNTKVVRARIVMHKTSGARIELFCLEPHAPSDYERAFSVVGVCEWLCIVGNSKKWKEGKLVIEFDYQQNTYSLAGERVENRGSESIVRFSWDAPLTFGQLLEHLGQIPIPPYLERESQEVDNTRYQTVYSRYEGSVAAPTAGLHFSESLLERITTKGVKQGSVTLHVGAGTFLPVKSDSVNEHPMHTEHFEICLDTIEGLVSNAGQVVAVGTTTVRTLESLAGVGYRIICHGNPDLDRAVGQWELYDIPPQITGVELLGAVVRYMKSNSLRTIKASTRIMIMPGYVFRVADNIITNFHQPRSTLLLLVSAFVGVDWRRIYGYALDNDFRFLSYGDSSILMR